ncbi:hypothetical protein [Gelidibacter salicanalis]|uniref:Uncharacterized protein n=1 Tax=Gelidibacter salicanalis TaxID=291193 RepID=A0A934KXF7_9FLAO|nr:hypothetical protein [Gelidibacter salicanalis]MBJ7883076.1 hypothetical protein [Gelidibacter salicanalis]
MLTIHSLKLIGLSVATAAVLSSCTDDDNTLIEEPILETKTLFTSNTADGNISYYDVTNRDAISSTTLVTASTAADGIYYDEDQDVIVQVSRSEIAIEGFLNLSLQSNNASIAPGILGTSDMESPREMAVKNDFYVVADNANAQGRFFVYQRTANIFTLRNTITTDFKVWGIAFHGNDLYAVVDADNELAVFTNFLSTTTDGELMASKRVVVEGIIRTHGLTYDDDSDTMVMTDIGDAANTQDDGGFHVITGFTGKFNALADGDTLTIANQIRISGPNTFLGNPVDVAYDGETGTVFIAEAGNAGGRVLAFEGFGNGGDIAPFMNKDLAGASAVYFED